MADARKDLFSFVVVADTHLRPEDTEAFATPWRSTGLANDRSRFVVREIERVGPAFVVHLGDMVHPVPVMETYGQAVALFRQIYGKLSAPLYTIPGNHDVGDKPGARMPAPNANDESVAKYTAHFGAAYSVFEHTGCRFLLLNSPVLGSGLAEETEQRDWLQEQLAHCDGQRVFLFTHYPLYLYEATEPSHYDNTDEPARSWLLGLIERHAVEAVFAGHVHNFFYTRHGGTDLYVVPSVTQVRQDYSELFRIGPAEEYGRNDTEKLGFFVVSVFADGHRVRFVKTSGRTLEGDAQREGEARGPRPSPVETSDRSLLPLHVELSHAWAETVELPLNYLVDGFVRKRVRNDYPMLALWGTRIRGVRVPEADLLDPATRARMALLRRQGHQIGVLTLGVPDESAIECLRAGEGLVDGVEVVMPIEELRQSAQALAILKQQIAWPVFVSPLETSANSLSALSKGAYVVRHGWRCSEAGAEQTLAELRDALSVDGFSFRVTAGEEPWDAAERIATVVDRFGCGARVTVQLAADVPAEAVEDDWAIAHRVVEAAAAALNFPQLEVVLDTFADVDRGYYVRHGLVDRRYNPREAAMVLAHLHAALAGHTPPAGMGRKQCLSRGRRFVWQGGSGFAALLLPQVRDATLTLRDWQLPASSQQLSVHDLSAGQHCVAPMNGPLPAAPLLVVAET